MSCEVYNIITFYQKSIKKARNNENELLHCINKLFELPVTIEHLQKTGVGKTVNSLRKYNGSIGIAAKTLVTKWKAMVSDGNMASKLSDNIRGQDNHENNVKMSKFVPNTRLNLKEFNSIGEDVAENGLFLSPENQKSRVKEKREKKRRFDEPAGSNNVSRNGASLHKGSCEEDCVNSSNKSIEAIKQIKMVLEGEIDSSMGASFSDALGMCNETNLKPKRNQKYSLKGNSTKKQILLKPCPEVRDDFSCNITPFHLEQNTSQPINQNYALSLPIPEKVASNSKSTSLSIDISSKTTRTKVYSGIKSGAVIVLPSLFDMCIRVLQKNIEALEYTGGVPFDVLRPLLQRITPQQLMIFEHYNSYLLDDSDILWKLHVNRYYRNEVKEEGETWREMFLRCEDEKEKRLNILTKHIKQSQKINDRPVRKTRLTYLDRLGKPSQIKNSRPEINEKLNVPLTPLGSKFINVRKNKKNYLPSPETSINRTKKAPLMVKTLQLLKKRYKK